MTSRHPATRHPARSLALVAFFTCLSLLLVACHGTTVSANSPSFVDSQTRAGIDTGSPNTGSATSAGTSASVFAPGSFDFVTPPGNASLNATLTSDERLEYKGYNAVKLVVWNGLGVQSLAVPEGVGAEVRTLKISVTVVHVDSSGAVTLLVNGVQPPAMHVHDEAKVGVDYVYLSDVYVGAS